MPRIQDYLQLLASLDVEIARLDKLHAALLSCGPRCTSCCQAFSVLPLEGVCLQEAVAVLPPASRERIGHNLATASDSCPLLLDELCSVYAARPVICRTQGLPLAYVDEERQAIEVSACPRNFPDDHLFVPEDLLFLDGFNARLFALNLAWCEGRGFDPARRIPLREIARLVPPGA